MAQTYPLESLYSEELYKLKPKVLIVIPKAWSDVNDDELILLGKILNSVKLSFSSVQVISLREFSAEDLKIYSPSCIVAFGATLKNSVKMYEIILIDGTAIVVAHEFKDLDDFRKRNLWMTLKQVFHC